MEREEERKKKILITEQVEEGEKRESEKGQTKTD